MTVHGDITPEFEEAIKHDLAELIVLSFKKRTRTQLENLPERQIKI